MAELTVNESLMNAAQDTSAHKFHQHTIYEARAAKAYGYPYGISCNLTWFNRAHAWDVAQKAVENWVKVTGAEPASVFTGGFPPMLRHRPWKYESIPCGRFLA